MNGNEKKMSFKKKNYHTKLIFPGKKMEKYKNIHLSRLWWSHELASSPKYVKLNINWDALGGRNVTNQKHIKLGFINARMLQSFDDEEEGEKNVSICFEWL